LLFDPSAKTLSKLDLGIFDDALTRSRCAFPLLASDRSVVFWSGAPTPTGLPITSGLLFDPAKGTYTLISATGAPSQRRDPGGVWTGSAFFYWGGVVDGPLLNDGGLYDPATDSWRAVTTAGAPPGVSAPLVVWTGTEAIVCGIHRDNALPTAAPVGGRY